MEPRTEMVWMTWCCSSWLCLLCLARGSEVEVDLAPQRNGSKVGSANDSNVHLFQHGETPSRLCPPVIKVRERVCDEMQKAEKCKEKGGDEIRALKKKSSRITCALSAWRASELFRPLLALLGDIGNELHTSMS